MAMPGMPGMMYPPMDPAAGGFYPPPYMPMAPMGNWMPMSGSAASFHLPGPKNEIKLFVGGL